MAMIPISLISLTPYPVRFTGQKNKEIKNLSLKRDKNTDFFPVLFLSSRLLSAKNRWTYDNTFSSAHTSDAQVSEFVLSQVGAQEFITNYVDALKPVVAGYMRENKRYTMIAIGCTGGKHRSVAVVKRIAELLSELDDVAVSVKHRDLGKE